ncbi:adenosine receptor A2b-like [Apostichopus japonicus]|uniref:adenosine receptor A2b-like n=1 Tax=Stichopus japonicus TaxID=307972 RepID=UPI003AB8E229
MTDVTAQPSNRTCNHQMIYHCPHISPTQMTVFIIWDAFILIGIVLGNSLVILSLLKYPRMRTPSNILLASLATADLFVAFVCLPVDILIGLGVLPWTSTWQCVGGAAAILSVSAVSTWHMTAVTFERYLAITKPYRHHTIMTLRAISILIIGTWTVAICVSSLAFLDFGNNVPCLQDGCCDLLLVLSPVLRVLAIVIGSLLPCMVMTVMYTKMIRCAQLQLKRISASEVQSCHKTKGAFLEQVAQKFQRRDLKAAKTVALVLGAFLIAWTPASAIALSDFIIPWFIDSHYSTFYILQLCLFHIAFANSFVNPVIYCYRNREFRNSFIKLLQICLPEKLKCRARVLEDEGVMTVACADDDNIITEVVK